MKKVIIIILAVVIVFAVAAGAYYFYQQQNKIFSAKDNLPSGYFIPSRNQIPAGYEITKKAFTENSILVVFKGKSPEQNLSFIETAIGSYDNDVSGSASSQLNKRTIQTFSYQGNPGVIQADFMVNLYDGSDQNNPNQLDNEYHLFYNHNGREVEIDTYDVKNITPEILLQFLKGMQITK